MKGGINFSAPKRVKKYSQSIDGLECLYILMWMVLKY